jgi:hypothetical protein
MTTDGNRQN